MRKLLIGIVIGMLISSPIAWAAGWAKAMRISDNSGNILDINTDGSITIK